jgi:hypothetical protein
LIKHGSEIFDVIVGQAYDHDPEASVGEILLMLQILVDRYEDIEAVLRQCY